MAHLHYSLAIFFIFIFKEGHSTHEEKISKVICSFNHLGYVDILIGNKFREDVTLSKTLMKQCKIFVRIVRNSREIDTENLILFAYGQSDYKVSSSLF